MTPPVDVDVSAGRLPAAIEATAYYVVAEALTNVAKHTHARGVTVTASVDDRALRVEVRDDGVGGARTQGSGLFGPPRQGRGARRHVRRRQPAGRRPGRDRDDHRAGDDGLSGPPAVGFVIRRTP
jgi:signal transduction histidine kinase